MIFAFTGLAALGTFFATYGTTILGVSSIALSLAGAGMSIYSGYQARSAANESARMQENAASAAANAQRMAAAAQAEQLKDQADLNRLCANIEEKKSAIAQEQGEIEQARRSRMLAADIGNAYAQWAGNGLLVDGGDDSLGDLLSANVREAGQDIGIIKSNTQNAVWEHQMNKSMSLISAKSYENQAGNALAVGNANAQATLLSGEAQAYATRQAGLTALYQGWGSGISALGSAALTGYGMSGGFATPKKIA